MQKKQKILFVCAANIDRSPTGEHIYMNNPGLEVKSAGTAYYARQPVTDELVQWADVIFCMEDWQKKWIESVFSKIIAEKTIINLDIPDVYRRDDPALVKMIKERVDPLLKKYNH